MNTRERIALHGVLWWSLVAAGYWVRPYDMIADRRRWRWRRPARCGWQG